MSENLVAWQLHSSVLAVWVFLFSYLQTKVSFSIAFDIETINSLNYYSLRCLQPRTQTI